MAQFEEYCVLKGHKLSIYAVHFSPNSKYLVSLGDRFDKGLFVWNIPDKTKITCNKLTKWVKGIAFNEEGKYFVTCGEEHLKFWYFDDNGEPIKSLAPSQTPTSAKNEIYLMENQPADTSKVDAKDFIGIV